MTDPAVLDDSEYSALVIEHFERPRNVGTFVPATDVIVGRAGRRDQGAEFAVSARVANDKIAEARFEAYGCPHCVAAGSWLAESLIGADRDRVQHWSWRELADALAIPTAKRGRLLILEDAVRALAEDWCDKEGVGGVEV
jgi:NifU-like protein involved in Fe-S cluster formation